MKKDIHPAYYQATVTCTTCGTSFVVGATEKSINVDTCSHCHSFYTGKVILNSKTGRIIASTVRLQLSRKQSLSSTLE